MPCTTSEAQGCKAHSEHQRSKVFLLLLHSACLASCLQRDVADYFAKRRLIQRDVSYQETSRTKRRLLTRDASYQETPDTNRRFIPRDVTGYYSNRRHRLQHKCQCTARDVTGYYSNGRLRSYYICQSTVVPSF